MSGPAWALLMLLASRAELAAAGVSCLSNPCLNGICIDDLSSNYSCFCVDGYTGAQCQTNWDECWSAPCRNGGACADGVASYNCTCPEGFLGDNCEINYNECQSSPCSNNATCVDLSNGFACACLPGFSGERCDLDAAVCNSSGEARCHNGGRCIDGPGFKFYCSCLPGWTGKKCEEAIDECASSPCQNGGVCIDAHADYMCACTYGFTSKNCETQIEFCSESACSSNALCVVEGGARVCYCVPDFHGERCELQYDECQLGPRCLNGGTCIDGVDNFTCSCPPKLTGLMCECLVLTDGTLDCEYVSPSPASENSSISTFVSTDDHILISVIDITSTVLPETTTFRIIDHTFTKLLPTIDTDVPTIQDVSTDTNTPETSSPVSDITVTEDMSTTPTTYTTYTTETPKPEILTSQEPTDEIVTVCGEICVVSSNNTSLSSSFDITTFAIQTDATMATSSFAPITTVEDTVTPTYLNISQVSDRETTTVLTEVTTNEDLPTIKSTEKWFTENPSEHELPLTTEPTAVSFMPTLFDNMTDIYTTISSECSDSYCNDHGTCVLTPHGYRCVCHFNYGGEHCEKHISISSAAFSEKSYLAHKLVNHPSVHISFTARTLTTEGKILYVDIAPGIYMKLYLNAGLLKFMFSCGYQTMLLSELRTYLNNGFHIKVDALLDIDMIHQHCNATLHLNDTVAMSGGQLANITSLGSNFTLYLGNAPIHTTGDEGNKPFIGCIQDLASNGKVRKLLEDSSEAVDVRECQSLPCLSSPCLNGGSCRDAGITFACACANGFLGGQCERTVCERNPCRAGGTCVRSPGSGFLCLCPYGSHGMFCEHLAGGLSSYVAYPLSQMNSERFDIKFRFQTTDMDQIALLMFVGQRGKHDYRSQHIAVTFVKGYIMLTWNIGSGARRIFTPRPLGESRGGHVVRVAWRGRSAWLNVDSRYNVSGNAPGAVSDLRLFPLLYIGGHPSIGFAELPHDLPLHRGWAGCVWEVAAAAGAGAARADSGRGVGQCGVAQCHARACTPPNGVCLHHPATYGCVCSEGWFGATCSERHNPCDEGKTRCRGYCVLSSSGEAFCDCPYGKMGKYCDQDLSPTDVLLSGTRSYIKLHPQTISSVSLSLEAELKPSNARGLVLFADADSFHTALSVQGGLLEYRWADKTSGIVSVVRSGVVVSLEQWHTVKAGRYGSKIYVWVDGTITTQNMAAHTYPHTSANTSFLIGGAADLSRLPHDAMSAPLQHFSGCVRNLHVNNVLLPLESSNIQEGVNVLDCDGTACGAERCGAAGACRVEGGRAVCACGAGEGARCRRHAACDVTACAPPRGRCRNHQCVCLAGYTGANCTKEVTITTAHFGGESMMLVRSGRARGKLRDVGEGENGRDVITLNFTTAEPIGLLLWIQQGNKHIGIGLEDGFLAMSYSSSQATGRPAEHAKQAGQGSILADAEWHTLALYADSDITVLVDGNRVHFKKPSVEIDLSKANIFIGGISPETLASNVTNKPAFYKNFRGCIDHITTNGTGLIEDFKQIYSENVGICQLLPEET